MNAAHCIGERKLKLINKNIFFNTKKAAAVAKSHSSTLYFKYNERTTTYANILPPLFWSAQIKDVNLTMKYE